jgi:7,8-dihydropterin-6-yl-methyl-4-(beta-D-ribofuranosyl)aminobenzene 5'-phosphate synthase
MRITTLVENALHPRGLDLKAEHGLSFYVEHQDHVFMSDVGQSGNFADNAEKLGIDLSQVDALAITHHHYDHGGGLLWFMQKNSSAKVYLRWAEKADYVAKSPMKPLRNIGLDQAVLEKFANRVVYLTENFEILPGIHLLTEIPQLYPKPGGDRRLKTRRGRKIQPDTFEHELVTVLLGEQGLVILTGCAHNGVLNMIAAAKTVFPDRPIRAVIGGFHLKHENAQEVSQIGEALLDMDIPLIYTGHCTGDESYAVLKSVLGERLHQLHTGLVMAF